MNQKAIWVACIILALAPAATAQKPSRNLTLGSLSGQISDAESDQVPRGVTLSLANRLFQRTITVDGDFVMEAVPPGSYTLEANADGYQPYKSDVEIREGEDTRVSIALKPQRLSLSQVVVAPSTISVLEKSPTAVTYLDRDAINNTPHLSNDVYRTLTTLPGISGNDVSASFNLRGGDYREVTVTLDGMELYEPFHIKDFTGVFSIIDAEIVGGLDLVSGGFTAEAGNAMSGLMRMRSAQPTERRSSVGVSFSTAHYSTEGTFNNGLGSYLFSARRGWLDILLGFTDEDSEEEQEESTVAYWDSFGKLTYVLRPAQKLSVHFLAAADDFEETEREDGEIENAANDYGNGYFWLNLDSFWNDRLSSRTTLFSGGFDENVDQDSTEPSESFDLLNQKDFSYQGLKQDWRWEVSPRAFWRAGFEWRSGKADYSYSAVRENDNPLVGPPREEESFALSRDGDMTSVYVSGRFRLSETLTSELGLRYDEQNYLDDTQISPRVNLAWKPGGQSTWRLAWGRYHQAQRLHELATEDGETSFADKAERATHWLLGYETRFDSGLNLRVEGYHKQIDDPRPYYINLFEVINVVPSQADDRYRVAAESAEISGLEVTLKQDLGGRMSWFVNYAWSTAEDVIDGVKTARQWDQEHTVTASLNYRRNRKWNFNGAWTYHTGWRITPFTFTPDPTTEEGYRFELGALNSDKLSAYHRLDLRINRTLFRRNGRGFNLYIDVQNLYNRANPAGFEEFEVVDVDGVPSLQFEQAEWLPILPSFGVNWIF
ncbi:MAG: TonB-dependent receptor [Acidobacteriota bacterium]|nr:TonB-dependent receptor [Acidobacteriota bacterium]